MIGDVCDGLWRFTIISFTGCSTTWQEFGDLGTPQSNTFQKKVWSQYFFKYIEENLPLHNTA